MADLLAHEVTSGRSWRKQGHRNVSGQKSTWSMILTPNFVTRDREKDRRVILIRACDCGYWMEEFGPGYTIKSDSPTR